MQGRNIMNTRTRDLLCGAVFFLLGIFMYLETRGIPTIIENEVGSAFVPKRVAVVMICLAGLLIAVTFFRKGTAEVKTAGDLKGGASTIIALAAYVFLFDKLGFIIATTSYLFVQILILSDDRNRNPKLFAVVSVVASVAVYLLFSKALGLILPSGILGGLPL